MSSVFDNIRCVDKFRATLPQQISLFYTKFNLNTLHNSFSKMRKFSENLIKNKLTLFEIN